MGDISTHFNRSEFSCFCRCGFDCVDKDLLNVLEMIRDEFEQPVIITSGNRCQDYNDTIPGSAPNSQHTKGMAADIKVKNTEPSEVYEYLNFMFPDTFGLGLYKTWVHVDVRKDKARW